VDKNERSVSRSDRFTLGINWTGGWLDPINGLVIVGNWNVLAASRNRTPVLRHEDSHYNDILRVTFTLKTTATKFSQAEYSFLLTTNHMNAFSLLCLAVYDRTCVNVSKLYSFQNMNKSGKLGGGGDFTCVLCNFAYLTGLDTGFWTSINVYYSFMESKELYRTDTKIN